MFDFTHGKPLPDHGLFGVYRRFARVKLQLTAFCHNRCRFCPLPDDTSVPKGIMDMDALDIIFRALPGFCGRVDLATDGESLLLPDLPERCARIKSAWPDCTLTLTSTFNIDRGPEYIRTLFASGLQELFISCYGHTDEDYQAIHGSNGFMALRNNLAYLKTVPDLDKKYIQLIDVANAGQVFGTKHADAKLHAFQGYAKSCGVRATGKKKLHSWQGRVPFGIQKARHPFNPCSVVWGGWADILNVRWDLEVTPCCYFTGHEFTFGNLKYMTLQQMFTSDKYRDFYRRHWEGREDKLPVCKDCTNYQSYASNEEHMRFAAWQGNMLAGEDVLFYGAGEAWRRYRELFCATHPVAMLLDAPDAPPEIAGIPVLRPVDALARYPGLPLLVFAYPQNSPRMLRSLEESGLNLKERRVLVCPANFLFSGESGKGHQ